MLIIRDVTKIYKTQKQKEVKALDQINYEFDEQGFYAILGKSGSGKSTLLNLIAGLDKPTSGEIILNGKSFSDFKRKDLDAYRNSCVGFIFQEFNLFDNLDVYKNVALALELQGRKAKVEEIEKVLDRVGISDLIHRNINELSGGQKQRVAIARALIKNPKIIIADEPTGALDQETTNEIFDLLKGLSKEYLVIVVTHNEEYANQYAEHILHLSDGKQKEQVELTNKPLEAGMELEYKKSLSIFSSLKMGFSNLKISIVRLVLCILLTTMAFSSLGFCLSLNFYSRIDIIYGSCEKTSFQDPITISCYNRPDENESWMMGLNNSNEIMDKIKKNTQLDFRVFNDSYTVGDFYIESSDTSNDFLSLFNPQGIVEIDEAYLKQLNFTITGTFPQSDDEILITDYYYNTFARYGFENEEIQLNAGEVTKEKIIGQKIYCSDLRSQQKKSLKICGILDTKLDLKPYEKLTEEDIKIDNEIVTISESIARIKQCSLHCPIYMRKDAIAAAFGPNIISSKLIGPIIRDKRTIQVLIDYLKTESNSTNKYEIRFGISDKLDTIIDNLNLIQSYMAVFGGVLMCFSIFLLFSLLNFTIENKKQEMGILRALGAKGKNLFFIYSSEAIYISGISLIFSFVCCSVLLCWMNNYLMKTENILVSVYHFSFLTYFLLFIIALVSTIVAITIPVLRVIKRTPAEAIHMEIK
ncbi:MAG: ABC transporter ATP-binding protein/permease [Anaeroplasmataceae bacterium]|nr:ABC transporter ATP-binding protein/permease [Anaeroplasmataceae bacterium]